MNQAPEGTVRNRDDRERLGPAGWLGVALVVTAVSLFLAFAPRYSPEPLTKKDQFGSVAAAYALAALWQRMPPDAEAFESALAGGGDFAAAARLLGLQAQSIRVTAAAILDARHPMILLLREDPDVVVTRKFLEGRQRPAAARYVVLAEIHGGDAVILDPTIGRFTMPVPDLVESMGEVGTMWVPHP
jgi:hypothetical protein